MAFIDTNFAKSTVSDGRLDTPFTWTYQSADDLATINTTDYFVTQIDNLSVGDQIYVVANDTVAYLEVTVASGGSVVTTVFFASTSDFGIFSSTQITSENQGGSSETYTISGILTTDLPYCQMDDAGSGLSIVRAQITAADTLTVVFGAAPSTDTVFNALIVRAN